MVFRSGNAILFLILVALALAPGASAWAWPVDGPVLRPFVSEGDPYAGGQHRGIDIGAPTGSDVRSAAGGRAAAGAAGAGSGSSSSRASSRSSALFSSPWPSSDVLTWPGRAPVGGASAAGGGAAAGRIRTPARCR